MRHDLAGVAGEVEQEVELFRGEVNGFAADADEMGCGVNGEVAFFDNAQCAFRCAAQIGADACQKFLNSKWFGDVIISAGVKGVDLGTFVVAYAENDDGRDGASTDGTAEFDSGHLGHHEVGDDQVGGPVAEELKTLFGIVGRAHIVALRTKRCTQHAGDLRFVVDDKDTFGHCL